jgi:hypothetical protein
MGSVGIIAWPTDIRFGSTAQQDSTIHAKKHHEQALERN